MKNGDFEIDGVELRFKKDKYPLKRLRRARVKINHLSDHITKALIVGAIFSSIVWIICPEGFATVTAPAAFIVGVIYTVLSAGKYELQVEFEHVDETGLQWVSVVKSNKNLDKALLDDKAEQINTKLATADL
ncbi:hypothetical protein [Vibrio sp. SCSIO 43136]|uniref:hypothetical protein n=1 Tax=Vibrio sp. SCSIO 43136 TaxID=2819101 RepID=UPI002074D7F0|nr:hypothetical protein [Vibrio sp. SCSIO 43136]USD66956.1 hypothetical protein J4N39_20140 [Vibrio sp. SCSIO 43136]